MHPFLRLFSAIDPRDLTFLLPPVAAAKALRMAFGDRDTGGPMTPEGRDPEFLGKIVDAVRWIGERWFRHRAVGLDNVPAEGPALLVGNHSGGLMVFDGLLTYVAVWDHFGPDRAIYGLAHDLIQWEPSIRRYARRFGALPAGHENAEVAFRAGHLVLVYPGSDFDSFRPFAERDRVNLAGRTGFVRLALRNRVPIVPVVTAGAQEQLVILTRGEGIARLLRLKERLRTNVFPLSLSLPWGLTSAYLPYVPLPAQITTSFLPPLRFDLPPEAAADDEAVDRCYRAVEATLQAELTRLYEGRRPWLGVR